MIYNDCILRWFFRRVITLYKGVLNDRIDRNIGIRLRTSRPEGSLIVRNVPHWGGFFIFAIRNEFLKVQLFTFNYLWTSSYIDSIAFTMLHFFELINPNMSPEWYTRIYIYIIQSVWFLFFFLDDRIGKVEVDECLIGEFDNLNPTSVGVHQEKRTRTVYAYVLKWIKPQRVKL